LKGRIDIENDPDVVEQLVVNDLPYLEFCFVFWHGNHRSRIRGYPTAMHNLAVVVPVVAVAAVCRGEELEERQGLVPGAGLPVAWVFGLRS
jgi:hypothetical protein